MTNDENEDPKTEVMGGPVDSSFNRFMPTHRSRPKGATIGGVPTYPSPDKLAEITAERRAKFIEEDHVVRVVGSEGSDALAVLQAIKLEISREAASLQFDRIEFERSRKDPTAVSSRRIDALRRIADIELKIRELDQHAINLQSEKMNRIFALWVEAMQEVATEVLEPEVMDLFFKRLAVAMEGWEERAQNALR